MMRAHPRSRGEHLGIDNTEFFVEGSSPLARGTLGFLSNGCGCGGLIPARAGNTPAHDAHRLGIRAHPRSRGEHLGIDNTEFFVEGSSPLARGTLEQSTVNTPHLGLIPARAGNTLGGKLPGVRSGAHPRSRGEHADFENALTEYLGSSPLARGTPEKKRKVLRILGLIPARAGNTLR